MPEIAAVATAVPPYRIDQADAREFAARHFSRRFRDIDRLLPVFANAAVETRYFARPMDWMIRPHTLAERNEAYVEAATELSATSARSAMALAGIGPDDIDSIVYVNTTGLATPSIDAWLVNILGLRSDIRRTPLWGLGCAGGVAGLAHAYHHVLGHPQERVLLVATELCGLTFLPDDYSKSNLIATALFADGSAAVVVCGDDVARNGIDVVATKSTFYPDSLDVMGWHVVANGLQVVFAERIPTIVEEHAAREVMSFLGAHHLTIDDVAAFLVHPGGTKIIEAYERALSLPAGALDIPRGVLRDFGNMSSVTALFVLQRYLEGAGTHKGDYALLSALGPGFCSESMLVRL